MISFIKLLFSFIYLLIFLLMYVYNYEGVFLMSNFYKYALNLDPTVIFN